MKAKSLFLTGLGYKEQEKSRNEAVLDTIEHHVGEMTSCDLSIEHFTKDTILLASLASRVFSQW